VREHGPSATGALYVRQVSQYPPKNLAGWAIMQVAHKLPLLYLIFLVCEIKTFAYEIMFILLYCDHFPSLNGSNCLRFRFVLGKTPLSLLRRPICQVSIRKQTSPGDYAAEIVTQVVYHREKNCN